MIRSDYLKVHFRTLWKRLDLFFFVKKYFEDDLVSRFGLTTWMMNTTLKYSNSTREAVARDNERKAKKEKLENKRNRMRKERKKWPEEKGEIMKVDPEKQDVIGRK
ncbi:hypothetical protein RCL_jg28642.t1 [Rhizophagus clarus]|uniref:Uncharacterized protein n=1 Tax=Rhizophagus clarus TaxID=94130 RepID=A0A8H3QU53_9GLOM|nr:hypothetical protein RCL_jg28642.t1 [Rhizophagus clarus]